METTAIIGYGCFGQALASLILEEGQTVRAFDPHNAPPNDVAVPTLADAVTGAQNVVVAVPVPVIHSVIESIVPHLDGTQLVMDVGSVKVRPIQAMSELLGAEHPWVGTHPLFGPNSLAMGEHPLRVVVCPNTTHPDAASKARAFYERLHCLVIEQDAESHDRAMADCHALTYFVAKGLMDANVNLRSPFAPPSSRAIARTVREVRTDSGHLFGILHRENPFAADSRARLLEALSSLDRNLATAERETASAVPESLTIPAINELSSELKETRDLIDLLDDELLALLARRTHLAQQAKAAKDEIGHGVLDPEREAQVLADRRERGEALGLDPDSLEDVIRAVLRFSRRAQR